MSTKADLTGTGKESTISLVVLPQKPNQDYEGYVRIGDEHQKISQVFTVKGYNILNPVQIHVVDVTNDGKPDIILETDELANGGLGAHDLHMYIQEQNGRFIEQFIPDDGDTESRFSAAYRPSTREFTVSNMEDNRTWRIQISEKFAGQLEADRLDEMSENRVHVDPISSIDLMNNKLATKRYVWFGRLQLNGLAVLETEYVCTNGNWRMKQYHLQSVESMTKVAETE
ncbi:hypothetical protein [Paenibacillus sp. SI8]|uniref:hypothetical protein n=1 Tax=unclassified Paenibacillus TaxID=185978 RepID=UPI003465D273